MELHGLHASCDWELHGLHYTEASEVVTAGNYMDYMHHVTVAMLAVLTGCWVLFVLTGFMGATD